LTAADCRSASVPSGDSNTLEKYPSFRGSTARVGSIDGSGDTMKPFASTGPAEPTSLAGAGAGVLLTARDSEPVVPASTYNLDNYRGVVLDDDLHRRMSNDGIPEEEIAMFFLKNRRSRTSSAAPMIATDENPTASVHLKPIDLRTVCKSSFWSYLDTCDLATVKDSKGLPFSDKIVQKFADRKTLLRKAGEGPSSLVGSTSQAAATAIGGTLRTQNVNKWYLQLSRLIRLRSERELVDLVISLKYSNGMMGNSSSSTERRWLTSEMGRLLQNMLPTADEFEQVRKMVYAEHSSEAGVSSEAPSTARAAGEDSERAVPLASMDSINDSPRTKEERQKRVDRLDRPYKVFWYLGNVRRAHERLQVLDIFYTWRGHMSEINKMGLIFQSGVAQINNMLPLFKPFCAAVLAIANYMNADKKAPGAEAKALSLRDMVCAEQL
jgi:hypothetical protein